MTCVLMIFYLFLFDRPQNVPRLYDLVRVKDDQIRTAFYFALRNTLVANDLKRHSDQMSGGHLVPQTNIGAALHVGRNLAVSLPTFPLGLTHKGCPCISAWASLLASLPSTMIGARRRALPATLLHLKGARVRTFLTSRDSSLERSYPTQDCMDYRIVFAGWQG